MQRVLSVAKVWACVVAFVFLTGHAPSFGLVTVAVIAATTVLWLLTDVATSVESAEWGVTTRTYVRAWGKDSRATSLHRQLNDLDDRDFGASRREQLAAALLAIVDGRVAATHGVRRDEQPARFAEIVGPDLTHFVADVEAGSQRLSLRTLPDLLRSIEQL